MCPTGAIRLLVACYQRKPDGLLKKPLVARCLHTDILGGGLSQVIILKIAACVFGECADEKQNVF